MRTNTRIWLSLLVPAVVGAGLSAPAAAAPGAPPAAARTDRLDPALARATGDVKVVVQERAGAAGEPERLVRQLGGRVTLSLPLISGFAATVPAAALPRLATAAGVRAVSADRAVRVRGAAGGAEATGTTGTTATTVATATTSLAPQVVRAPDAWAAGVTGAGVTVALLDTGIADVPDLAGRIVPVRDDRTGVTSSCRDLSGEGSCRDSYGHGTFMAGLIAGDGSTSAGTRTGTAPGANLLSVKVAGASGAADVSTVLGGIQWVVSFQKQYGIRVLNLSLGTDSTQSWHSDPLDYAVERAWDAGITVVVAAANNGPAAGTIAKPGDDPWVVTVGAADDRGTLGIGDDRSPDFSSRGPAPEGVAKPDLVAPGAHTLSLRSAGSTIETQFPVAGSARYRKGSGTSMATAVVSGVAALALQAHPTLTPNQLKHALRAGARPVASRDPDLVGAGLVDARVTALSPPPGADNAGLARSSGLGELDASRGSVRVQTTSLVPTVMSGRQTAQLLLWDPYGFTSGDWTPTTWYTSANELAGWNTMTWVSTLNGQNWAGQNWAGQNWAGSDWTGSSWYAQHENSSSYGRTGAGSVSYGGWD